MAGPPFFADFQSGCANCYEPIEIGQIARMDYDGAVHDNCPPPALASSRPVCTHCWLVHAVAQEDCE